MQHKILYIEKDADARTLAKRVGKAKGDRVIASQHYLNPISSRVAAKLKRVSFAVCSFHPEDNIKNYQGLHAVAQAVPLAIITNIDVGATRAALRSIGVEIPCERIFDRCNSTFANICTEMKRELGIQATPPAREDTALVAQISASGSYLQLPQPAPT